jgi:hypothetical protein
MEFYIYTLPSHWAPALINGDYSGLDAIDEEHLNEWLDEIKPGYCVDCSQDEYFSSANDCNNVGGMVSDFTFQYGV